jgi:Peptidase MA superfamily
VIALGRGRLGRLLLALAASLALLAPAAPVQAATFTFSDPQTSSTFNQGIDFSIKLNASEAPGRVELQITFPGATGPFVVEPTDPAAAGSSTLHYTLDTTGSGHLMPNTPISFSWDAYPQGGGTAVSSAPSTYRYTDDTQKWQTLRDGLITVHWVQGPTSFAGQAAAWGTKALEDGGKLLGVDETTPVDFYAYADVQSFRAAIGGGARQNVGGSDYPDIRTFVSLLTPATLSDPYTKVTIVHELTHQVVFDATDNAYRSLPRWLNEGFAVYQAEGNTPFYRGLVRDAISSGDLLPLTALGWQFPTDPQKTFLGYAESVSAVDYIVRTYSKDALVKLILAYKNGPTDDEALTAAIGKGIAAFQAEWYQAIGATAPAQFGPQPAPTGPLPSGWTGPAATQVPAASNAAGASGSPKAAASGSSEAAASTPSLAATIATTPASSGGSGSGSDLALVLGALVVVSGAVLAGIVLASRRAASP